MLKTIIDIKRLDINENSVVLVNTRDQAVFLEQDLRNWALFVNTHLRSSFPLRVLFTNINGKNYANII